MSDQIKVYTQGAPWSTDRQTWAEDIETWAGDTGYLEQVPGPDGPTHFIRLGTERLTPRAAGDLIIDPNVAALDWGLGWVYPTLLQGWVAYDGGTTWGTPKYRKVGGGVCVSEGLMKNGTVGYVDAYVLAAGYRPSQRIILPAMNSDNVTNGRMDYKTNGGMQPVAGSSGWFTVAATWFAEL